MLSALGRRTIRRAHRRLGLHPTFLPLVLRLTPLGPSRTISADTDLVVEGFPRSGNTWTAFSLRHANPELAITSHAHVPAQVRRAVVLERPTLVVVRRPIDAVASLLVAAPHVTPRQGLRDHLRHHQALLPLTSSIVVADFNEVTSDLGMVADRVASRFGLPLTAPGDDERAAILHDIDAHHRDVHGGAMVLDPRPLTERRPLIDAARLALSEPTLADVLARADAVYEQLKA